MAYLKINDIDFSAYVNKLKVGTEHIYKGRTNASGNTSVKYVNTKRVVEVGIIPLSNEVMSNLQKEINKFVVKLSYLNPQTKQLEDIDCMIPTQSVEYYTIQGANNTKFQACALAFKEL